MLCGGDSPDLFTPVSITSLYTTSYATVPSVFNACAVLISPSISFLRKWFLLSASKYSSSVAVSKLYACV